MPLPQIACSCSSGKGSKQYIGVKEDWRGKICHCLERSEHTEINGWEVCLKVLINGRISQTLKQKEQKRYCRKKQKKVKNGCLKNWNTFCQHAASEMLLLCPVCIQRCTFVDLMFMRKKLTFVLLVSFELNLAGPGRWTIRESRMGCLGSCQSHRNFSCQVCLLSNN